MAGLGLGHLAGGHMADRSSPWTCLKLFAAAEACIAAFGLSSDVLYYDLLYQRLGPLDLPSSAVGALLFASLLWPTFFMGVSLPLLARATTENLDRAAVRIGQLYGFNTLGAAAGALVSTWLLLPRVGFGGALWIGGATNVICALLVVRWLRRSPSQAPTPQPRPETGATVTIRGFGQRAFIGWAALFGLSGFLALSLEIVWFRLLGVIVKSTAFTFGTLLAVYLAGVGSGALAGIRIADRLRNPSAAFLMLQGGVGLAAGLTLALFLAVVARLDWLEQYFAGYEPLNVGQNLRRLQLRAFTEGHVFTNPGESLPWEAMLLYVVVPVILIGPATFLMGVSFPVLQRVVQTDFARLGRHVGALLLANIAGSAAGALVTGWIALTLLGTAGTIKALLILSALFPLFAVVARTPTAAFRAPGALLSARTGAAALTVALIILVPLLPRAEALWATLHGARVDRMVFSEDATGLSVLRMTGTTVEEGATVFVNGLGQSAMPYGGIHTALGLLPAFIHPRPTRILMIGLGSGDTAYAAAGRPDVETIESVEIVGPQLRTLKALAPRYPYGGLLGLLSDPRISHVAGDGRLALMRSAARFDIIEADALRPSSAYSGNLFSDGYFDLVRRRLRPQGLAVTWAPTERIHRAFVRVFPYVTVLPDILLGSNDPIVLDREAVFARVRDPRARAHYERAGINAEQVLTAHLVEMARYTPAFDRRTLNDFNTDLFPRDELDRPAPPWRATGDER